MSSDPEARTVDRMSAPPDATPKLPLHNCYWVVPGMVLAGEHPDGGTRSKTRQRLKRLTQAGIGCFLDLTQPSELSDYEAELPAGVEYVRRPIVDHGLPASRADMAAILELIQSCLDRNRPVYVHCRAGIGRTGMVIGCLLVERGLSGSEAVKSLNHLWRQCRRSTSWPVIPETDEQESYVRQWSSQRRDPSHAGERAVVAEGERRPAMGNAAKGPAIASAAKRPAAAEPARRSVPVEGTTRPAIAEAERRSLVDDGTRRQRTSATARRAVLADGSQRPAAADGVQRPPAAEAAAAVSDPLLEPDTLVAARGLRERFLGTLIGLAAGDALAASTQYRRRGSFTPVGDLIGGGPFDLPRGAWSDDTAMALCLAESLLQCSGFNARDQSARYARWQQEGYLSATGQCVGITASTARALAMSQWRRQVFAGSHDPKKLDPEPLSRVAAAVLYYFSDAEAALQHAAAAARTTCQSPAVLDACRQLARALHAALSGEPKEVILADVAEISEVAAHRNATAPAALAAAFWAFRTTGSFREAVLRAANVGGNSDVVAAVSGQLAGAHYGINAIPAAWRKALTRHDLIEDFADQLLTQSLISAAG